MKKMTVVLMLLAFSFGIAFGAVPEGWTADFAAAQKKAAAEKKLMYVLFTGSDWCPWCMKLKKAVLDTPEFKKIAGQSLVPVFLDFPRGKAVPMKQRVLAQTYSVRGYPTAFLMDADGRVVHRFASRPDVKEPYLKELQTAVRQNKLD